MMMMMMMMMMIRSRSRFCDDLEPYHLGHYLFLFVQLSRKSSRVLVCVQVGENEETTFHQ